MKYLHFTETDEFFQIVTKNLTEKSKNIKLLKISKDEISDQYLIDKLRGNFDFFEVKDKTFYVNLPLGNTYVIKERKDCRKYSYLAVVCHRKLKGNWTINLQQDIKCFSHIDVQAEMVNVLASQISREIDQEIFADISRMSFNFED